MKRWLKWIAVALVLAAVAGLALRNLSARQSTLVGLQ